MVQQNDYLSCAFWFRAVQSSRVPKGLKEHSLYPKNPCTVWYSASRQSHYCCIAAGFEELVKKRAGRSPLGRCTFECRISIAPEKLKSKNIIQGRSPLIIPSNKIIVIGIGRKEIHEFDEELLQHELTHPWGVAPKLEEERLEALVCIGNELEKSDIARHIKLSVRKLWG